PVDMTEMDAGRIGHVHESNVRECDTIAGRSGRPGVEREHPDCEYGQSGARAKRGDQGDAVAGEKRHHGIVRGHAPRIGRGQWLLGRSGRYQDSGRSRITSKAAKMATHGVGHLRPDALSPARPEVIAVYILMA